MSTTVLTGAVTATAADRPALRTSVPRAIRSEWIKLRSLRSTWVTLAGLFAAIVVFGLGAAAVATGEVSSPGAGPMVTGGSPLSTVLSGAHFGILILAVLGVLVGARE